MKEGFLKLFVFLMSVVLLSIMVIFQAFSYGLVIHLFWGWFLVPVFGLSVFPVIPAAGVGILITFIVGNPLIKMTSSKHKDDNRATVFYLNQAENIREFRINSKDAFHDWFYMTIVTPGLIIALGWMFS